MNIQKEKEREKEEKKARGGLNIAWSGFCERGRGRFRSP